VSSQISKKKKRKKIEEIESDAGTRNRDWQIKITLALMYT
jgi:hypothetical protein